MTRKTGMLFDLDGVLVDSEGEYSKFWGSMGDRYGLGHDFNQRIKGTTLFEILTHFPEADRDGIAKELAQFESNMEYRVYPGVKEYLQRLHDEGIPTAIVTSSDDVKMSMLFQKRPELRHAATKLVTANMVTKSKPDPECFLLGAELIGVPIEDCTVFEDSVNGLRAGRASGAKVIGLMTTNPPEVVEPLCDRAIHSFEELL